MLWHHSKNTATCGLEKSGIELPTFRLDDLLYLLSHWLEAANCPSLCYLSVRIHHMVSGWDGNVTDQWHLLLTEWAWVVNPSQFYVSGRFTSSPWTLSSVSSDHIISDHHTEMLLLPQSVSCSWHQGSRNKTSVVAAPHTCPSLHLSFDTMWCLWLWLPVSPTPHSLRADDLLQFQVDMFVSMCDNLMF